jgi:hypothetical protein
MIISDPTKLRVFWTVDLEGNFVESPLVPHPNTTQQEADRFGLGQKK